MVALSFHHIKVYGMQWDNIAIMIFSFTSFFKGLVAYPTRRIPVPEPQAKS